MSETIDERVKVRPERLGSLCRRYHVVRLSLFGSVLGEDFRPESDLDVLVEFEPGRTPGFEFVRLQRELSELFGYTVDLHTYHSLSRYFRDDVLRESRTIFDASESKEANVSPL
jgi:predicted nucleotidyltransferase